jgi:hypothetical protein
MIFLHFPLNISSVISCGNRLSVISLKRKLASRYGINMYIRIAAGNVFLLSTEQWQANFHYWLIGLPLSVICSRRPIEMDKLKILAETAETGFLDLRASSLEM